MAHPGGRPSKYSLELAKEICNLIAVSPRALKFLCNENPHWPHVATIGVWARDNAEFSALYAQAKRDQVDIFMNEILEIILDDSQDVIVDSNGKTLFNAVRVHRHRLQVDTFKWIASKLVPRLYGDRIQIDTSSDEAHIKKAKEEVAKLKIKGETNGRCS